MAEALIGFFLAIVFELLSGVFVVFRSFDDFRARRLRFYLRCLAALIGFVVIAAIVVACLGHWQTFGWLLLAALLLAIGTGAFGLCIHHRYPASSWQR